MFNSLIEYSFIYVNYEYNLFLFLDIKLELYDKALEDLREVIESDPKNVKAHFRRGSCFKAISMYCLVSIVIHNIN